MSFSDWPFSASLLQRCLPAWYLAAVPRYLRERRLAEVQLESRPGFTPPLSLLKPLHGAEPDLDPHLASFFEQDYPEFEILFCARS